MTDRERARAFFERYHSIPNGTDALAEQFAAVRLEERRAIVAYLRRRVQAAIRDGLQPSTGSVISVYVASVEGEADRIERGEHVGG